MNFLLVVRGKVWKFGISFLSLYEVMIFSRGCEDSAGFGNFIGTCKFILHAKDAGTIDKI